MINKFYDLATMQPKVPATVQSHYELLKHKASECVGCHACESRYPFRVPIAERMEKNSQIVWILMHSHYKQLSLFPTLIFILIKYDFLSVDQTDVSVLLEMYI